MKNAFQNLCNFVRIKHFIYTLKYFIGVYTYTPALFYSIYSLLIGYDSIFVRLVEFLDRIK